jgi:dienelactone hydrolase
MLTGRTISAALLVLALASAATAEVRTRVVEYKQGDTVLQGLIAWNDAVSGRRPGVLVVHEWWGHNEHARNQARRLAESGYVAFALDMYGKGKVATHPKDAEAFMTEATKNPDVIVSRFDAALAQLKQDPNVDPQKIAAIGYCFGGGVVLAMARAGADLDAIASFHGSLAPHGGHHATPGTGGTGRIKARILVMTGAADPMVPPAQVDAFKQEMTAAGATFEVVSYPGAKHSFTNPDADKAGMAALGYSADADRQSWAALLAMLKQVSVRTDVRVGHRRAGPRDRRRC